MFLTAKDLLKRQRNFTLINPDIRPYFSNVKNFSNMLKNFHFSKFYILIIICILSRKIFLVLPFEECKGRC